MDNVEDGEPETEYLGLGEDSSPLALTSGAVNDSTEGATDMRGAGTVPEAAGTEDVVNVPGANETG